VMKSAQADMREIYRYIAEDLYNQDAAEGRIADIEESIRSLKKMPTRFPFVLDRYLASKGFRMIVVKAHLVFFIVREDIKTVSVMRVLYNRRDWMQVLMPERMKQ
ncbi:MAG: type II toxin-antitoxin system RelE/ParE family toxin, partial [Defluviitaleaceae bacterium]|nr:type II toxin-antitoxin system RelE/ParE family toxin [Defluviitaleaceae bacterium]